jgi:hypothetical protein
MILFNHDVLKRTQISARVRAVSATAVALDEVVTMESGKTYAIRFRKLPSSEGDDLSILRSVTTVVGESDTVFVTGSGVLPNVGDLAMFGESDSVTKEMIVREVEGAENLARRFTLVDHAPQIETLADAGVSPAWNGRIGEPIGGYGPRLDFSKTANSQYLPMVGVGHARRACNDRHPRQGRQSAAGSRLG